MESIEKKKGEYSILKLGKMMKLSTMVFIIALSFPIFLDVSSNTSQSIKFDSMNIPTSTTLQDAKEICHVDQLYQSPYFLSGEGIVVAV